MKNFRAIVSEKGQITIPKRVRDRLGLKGGQVLQFDTDRGQLIVRKKDTREKMPHDREDTRIA